MELIRLEEEEAAHPPSRTPPASTHHIHGLSGLIEDSQFSEWPPSEQRALGSESNRSGILGAEGARSAQKMAGQIMATDPGKDLIEFDLLKDESESRAVKEWAVGASELPKGTNRRNMVADLASGERNTYSFSQPPRLQRMDYQPHHQEDKPSIVLDQDRGDKDLSADLNSVSKLGSGPATSGLAQKPTKKQLKQKLRKLKAHNQELQAALSDLTGK